MSSRQGGLPGYRGFEYQIEATVWVALHVMLETAACASITVEPEGHEDAELDVPPDQALSTITLDGGPSKRFMLQFKTRGTGPWTSNAFAGVVGDGVPVMRAARGPKPRARALEVLLGQPNSHYVLVTNAGTESSIHNLVTESLLVPPSDGKLRSDLTKSLTAAQASSLKGRVAILQVPSELIALRTKELISAQGKVPLLRVAECLEVLKHQVRQRLLGRLPSALAREDIVPTFVEHGGAPGAMPGPAYFPPTNFAAVQAALASRNVVLLLGPPGIGKTVTAEHLLEVHRRDAIPFAFCRERADAGVIDRHLRDPGPVYFLVSDPWGVSGNRGVSALTHELPRLIRSANADKRFVITSRTDVYEQVDRVTHVALQPFAIQLRPQDYTEETRWRIATQELLDRPSALRIVTSARDEILATLRTPLELALFSSLFIRTYLENPAWDDELVHTSPLLTSLPIATAIGQLIEQAGSVGSGQFVKDVLTNWRATAVEHVAVCWTMFEAFEALDEKSVVDTLQSVGARLGLELNAQQFLDFLKANDIAYERGHLLSIHSTALRGMRDLLDAAGAQSLRAVEALADHYVAQIDSGADGMLERAMEVIRAWGGWRGRDLEGFSDAGRAIDRQLASRCLHGSHDDFVNAVFSAMAWSRARDPFVQFVRSWGPDESDSTPPWFPPNLSDAQVESLIASGMAAQFLPRFVAELMPNTRIWYGFENRDFVQFIKRFRVDLGRAARVALKFMHDRKYLDRGDGATDTYHEDVNEEVLRALLAEYSDRPFPPPPAATAPWDL